MDAELDSRARPRAGDCHQLHGRTGRCRYSRSATCEVVDVPGAQAAATIAASAREDAWEPQWKSAHMDRAAARELTGARKRERTCAESSFSGIAALADPISGVAYQQAERVPIVARPDYTNTPSKVSSPNS